MNISFEQFAELAVTHDLIPIYDSLPSDLDTPVGAFLKIASGVHDFLFESVVGGEKWARYSFLGTRPHRVYRLRGQRLEIIDSAGHVLVQTVADDPLSHLQGEVSGLKVYHDSALPRFFGGAVGYLAYDMVKHFENIQLTKPRRPDVPDYYFMITDTVTIFDSFMQVMRVVCCARVGNAQRSDPGKLRACYDACIRSIQEVTEKLRQALPVQTLITGGGAPHRAQSLTREQFIGAVKRAKEYIVEGDIFQVVPSLRFELDAAGVDPMAVYRALRRINPSPYMYYMGLEGLQIAGASPEVLVRVEDGLMQVRPIAGTRKRGRDEAHDLALEKELVNDPKEQAEHVMLVDLGRNDVGRVCVAGSVKVEDFATVERYSHVMHLVSRVSGRLSHDKTVFDAIRAAFPAGTLTGAPKIRAMEIIDELEPIDRGLYGGAVGYIGFSGNADFAIAIRTAIFAEDKVTVQAGAGIVYHSQPELEYKECCHKAGAVLSAIEETRVK